MTKTITKSIDGIPHVLVSHLISEGCRTTDQRVYECKMEMWERKLRECGPRFIDSIRERGVESPICYCAPDAWDALDTDTPVLTNGHHRVVCAWLLGIEYIPYTEDRCMSET